VSSSFPSIVSLNLAQVIGYPNFLFVVLLSLFTQNLLIGHHLLLPNYFFTIHDYFLSVVGANSISNPRIQYFLQFKLIVASYCKTVTYE
jgi:hypothetical protein